MQVLDPRGGTFADGLHELLWAMNNGDVGHSLGNLEEMMYSSWCGSLTPTIIHLLQACKKDGAANKCWGERLFISYPMAVRRKTALVSHEGPLSFSLIVYGS